MCIREALCHDPQGERQNYAMRFAIKTFSRAIPGAHRIASALLLSGLVLCNFGAQADVPYPKIGRWSVVYREASNLSGCVATAQFPDQTIFQMALIQSGTNKTWAIFISNPRWNGWIGKSKQHRLSLVTTKPWQVTFSTSGDSKLLSFTNASVEFMNTVADAASVEIMNDNNERLASVDLKDSAAAIRAIVNCVNEHPPGEHPPGSAPPPETETILSGTGFFVAPKSNSDEQSRGAWMHKSHSSAISGWEAVYSNNIRPRHHK